MNIYLFINMLPLLLSKTYFIFQLCLFAYKTEHYYHFTNAPEDFFLDLLNLVRLSWACMNLWG